MKRFLAALLCVLLLCGMVVSPAYAEEGDVVIDRADSVFPADTTISGDLIIAGDCPETIVLINVTVTGTLRVEADTRVTIRFQGTGGCGSIELNSYAKIIGGEHGAITVNTPIAYLEKASVESVTLDRLGGYFFVDGEIGTVTLNQKNSLVGGDHHAQKLVLNQPGCSWGGTYDSVEKNYTEETAQESSDTDANYGVKATLRLDRPTVSPAQSVIRATLTFTEVPEDMAGDYRIYWYIDDMYAGCEWHIDVEEGASYTLECSAHFEGVMPGVMPVWAELTDTYDSDIQLRFVTSVTVEGYSTAEYKDMEYGDEEFPYQINLIRNQNVIIVYGLDENGEYTKIVNVFVCSVGLHNPTPVGEFEINYKARWGSLNMDLWGQYVSQFNGNMLFHSVPYRTRELFNIEWEEYNLLGEPASSGCVRLAVSDAMWIYDHCRKGTKVYIYDSDEQPPVEKPVPVYIQEDSRLRGWCPTDPYEDNPTRAKNVPVILKTFTPSDRASRPEPLLQ